LYCRFVTIPPIISVNRMRIITGSKRLFFEYNIYGIKIEINSVIKGALAKVKEQANNCKIMRNRIK
jgi:hypothetical protein